MEETSKHGVLGRHQSCSEERIEVLSDTIERHHSSRNTPSLLYPESCSDGNWRSHIRKSICVTSASSKDFLKHDWMKELGSEVARQPEGEVARQAKGSQPTKPNPNPSHDRTERPVVCSENTSRSQEIDTRFSRESKNSILEEDANHDRTGRPVVCSQSERSMLNEVDNDFRISGLPHPVVKRPENSRVRELVKKIDNHPHRQDLQADLQQNNAYNPFSEKSKKMIKNMGNVELFEFFEADPKTQCKECLLYWSQGTVYCSCRHLLKENEASRGAIQYTLDFLSIQNYATKKGRPHGSKRPPNCPQFEKETHQDEFRSDPRPPPERSHTPRTPTRTRPNRRSLYPDAQGREERPHPPHDASRVLPTQKEPADPPQKFWKNRTGEESF